ncbi:unnamed protein product (macronuclear) [Paramecium tetraurelia]|uniref:Uncharacterized protein n=1 Tax=Paramecium tetraurelia TaxID=5888 RepID=A0ECY5_PARTE|nr:uncharacterized protein GSPATT00004021001 [Paramecium tetraurelia]CAK93152.1 unnamed protein product [Paramecium tetraurelia]|eukprot:XP_001460549.1 hypothetical protein (macronuclear) [Paramecium tetraurelia strain d4-2]
MIQIKPSEYTRPSISRSLIIHQQQKNYGSLSIPLRDSQRKGSELRIRQDQSPKDRIQYQFNQLKVKLNDALSRTTSPQPSIRSNQAQSTKEIRISELNQQRKESPFKLEVSFSNDSSIESSFDEEINQQFQQAKETLAKLTNMNINQASPFKRTQSPLNNRLSLPLITHPRKQSATDNEDDKINLQFLKSLEQNQDNKDIDEFYDNGELNINFQSRDLLQFIRYEQEVLELIHRTAKYSDIKQMKQEMIDQLNKFECLEEKEKKKQEEQKNQILKKLASKHQLLNTEDVNKANLSNKIAYQFIDKGMRKLEYQSSDD